MTRRTRLALISAAAALAAVLLAILLLGPRYAGGRIASAVTRATGLSCSIGDVRPGSGGLTLYRVKLGGGRGPEIEIDRLFAQGDLSRGRLSALRARDAVVDVRLPNSPAARFTGVVVEAAGLDSPGRTAARATISGNCVELNPLLTGRAKARFQRGRITLIAEPSGSGKGPEFDMPLTVRLENYRMTFTHKKNTVVDEGEQADILLRVRGRPGSLRVDDWDNLAAVVGWDEPPPAGK